MATHSCLSSHRQRSLAATVHRVAKSRTRTKHLSMRTHTAVLQDPHPLFRGNYVWGRGTRILQAPENLSITLQLLP